MKKRKILKIILPIFAVLFVSIFLSVSSFSKKVTLLPDFKNFPVTEAEIFHGAPAQVDFSSVPEALHFKTRIIEGAKKGPNFAGHYTVVTWGCGSPCQVSAVIDAITGKIVAYGGDNLSTGYGVEYKINSKMMMMDNPGELLKDFTRTYTTMPFPVRYFVLDAKSGQTDPLHSEQTDPTLFGAN